MMSKSQTNLMALALAEDFSTPNTSSKVDNTSEKLEASSIDNKTGASSIESVAKKSNRGYKGDIYEYDVMKNPTNKLDVGTELGFAKKVEDQAQRLGITNSKYNWIAEKSLTANLELPPEWSENETEDGFKFYFNSDTGESVWDHPGLSYFKDMYAQMVAADAEEKLDPATPIKTAWKPKEDSDDEHSSNSDSSSTSGDEEVITRKVATELTDKFVKEDAMYWHSQYDSLLVEVCSICFHAEMSICIIDYYTNHFVHT